MPQPYATVQTTAPLGRDTEHTQKDDNKTTSTI